MASDKELSDFLASVEKRAYKRSLFHVRNEEAALDIVQDSMMKLVEYYAPKPAQELPMLFQRILSNTTLDWFRRQKTRNALFTNYNDFGSEDDSQSTDFLEKTGSDTYNPVTESAQDLFSRTETVREIESALQDLPGRQREAFLLRYWEELDVAETASAMGCSVGSVKTHCSRAVAALASALREKGIRP